MPHDFADITEHPGAQLTDTQWQRVHHRYALACSLITQQAQCGVDVLEVACGTGIGLQMLANVSRSLVAFDRTGSVLATAREHASAVPLICGDAQQTALASHSFDFVCCFEAIYYLPEPNAFLAECRRLLRPGGTLLIGTSNPDWPAFVPGEMTIAYPSAEALTSLLRSAGFGEVSLFGILADEEQSARQQLISQARRIVLQQPLLKGALQTVPFLTAALQRASYGTLRPLPPTLNTADAAPIFVELPLTELPLGQADTRHRVLYAVAR